MAVRKFERDRGTESPDRPPQNAGNGRETVMFAVTVSAASPGAILHASEANPLQYFAGEHLPSPRLIMPQRAWARTVAPGLCTASHPVLEHAWLTRVRRKLAANFRWPAA